MRRASFDENGKLRCRTCGSRSLLARNSERGKRNRHLKCADCGQRQRYRQPKSVDH